MKRSIRLAAAAALVALPLTAAAGELRVTVEGIRSSRGTVLIGLYDSPETFVRALKASDRRGFLNDPDRFGAVALRANAALRSAVVFSNLEPGRYAAIAFHDENGNGKLDKNFLGVPVEPYGFSNNVEGLFGPPSFDEAAMVLRDGDSAIRIALMRSLPMQIKDVPNQLNALQIANGTGYLEPAELFAGINALVGLNLKAADKPVAVVPDATGSAQTTAGKRQGVASDPVTTPLTKDVLRDADIIA